MMHPLQQTPSPGISILACAGDVLAITLRLSGDRPGRALLRTNLGQAVVRREEIIAHTETDTPLLARDWHDLPMRRIQPGLFEVRIPLIEVGWFAAKACFLPAGCNVPEWPEGDNLMIKVAPAHTACANTIYTAFVRQFGPACIKNSRRDDAVRQNEASLDAQGYTVIPPSGTFRDLIRHLDAILGDMRFRIIQLLPIHPVPTTYARMGRFGSPFAGLDFLSVDPALAEFDQAATPLDQFRELVDAVHARAGSIFLDIPANHTGWSSTLQIHHPEWFRRAADEKFSSPGAWGVTWEDLVELDYRHSELRAYMADVFLFWVRQGVDGFRCDAGYMLPVETWEYIVARVRSEFPDTVFFLEGLGGSLKITEQLLSKANLDWAYSELFQIGDRAAMEQGLPEALGIGHRTGPLVHYAETHDNNRLAARGETYAIMRTALAAMLSDQGAFGVTNGVEWFATEKIDVHEARALNWGAPNNQVERLARINALLEEHPAFAMGSSMRMVQQGHGNALAVLRQPRALLDQADRSATDESLLILVNLDAAHHQSVSWPDSVFHVSSACDLLTDSPIRLDHAHTMKLAPGQVLCLAASSMGQGASRLLAASDRMREPSSITRRRMNLMALRIRHWLGKALVLEEGLTADALGAALSADPFAFCASSAGSRFPHVVCWDWPVDAHRVVPVPPGHLLFVRAPHPFRVRLRLADRIIASESSLPALGGQHAVFIPAHAAIQNSAGQGVLSAKRRQSCVADLHTRVSLEIRVFEPNGVKKTQSDVLSLSSGKTPRMATRYSGSQVRAHPSLCAVLGNGRGAVAQVNAAWGEVRSQYDALLSVNTDPHAPVDRRVFFTRCRAWLRHCGYSHAIDASCLESFEADPGGRKAVWHFRVPTGVGRWMDLQFSLSLTRGRNRAQMTIVRKSAPHGLPDADSVALVLRPDIEWRDAHGKTKAYQGPEQRWPAAIQAEKQGFVFRPESGEVCSIRLDQGSFHAEPQWQYMVGHPDDEARGLDGSSDLFSPGWFVLDLLGGEEGVLIAERADSWSADLISDKAHPDAKQEDDLPVAGTLPLPEAMRRAMDLFVVKRDDLLTVLAGFPWFLDWGRDTLIVLRGLAAAGRASDALDILREFGRFESQGTLPNMIRGNDNSNRDTSDAPLWFGASAAFLIEILGAAPVLDASCGRRSLREVLLSIARHYCEGTPNGIHMDRDTGLVYSPSHFTWMDTNYPAATPREGYPVEIQALWIAFLDLLSRHVDPAWHTLGNQARASLERLYWLPEEGWLADNLRASSMTSASQAVADDALRPNQLLALTLRAFPLNDERAVRIVRACESLLVPGGMRSLADRPVRTPLPVCRDGRPLNNPNRPYCGHYTGDEDSQRKPAYHNGTAWTWQFPLYPEALVAVYGREAHDAALALLASASEVIEGGGCVGQIPEILDGDAPHALRGCVAQAWGVSEWLRVWHMLEK